MKRYKNWQITASQNEQTRVICLGNKLGENVTSLNSVLRKLFRIRGKRE